MDRRTTLKWVLAAGAAWPLLERHAARGAAAPTAPGAAAPARGYGTDPDLAGELPRPASCGR